MAVERIHAPAGGINSDAAPDYVGKDQAPELENLLPIAPGRVAMRGPFRKGIFDLAIDNQAPPDAVWVFDDVILLRGDFTSDTTYRCDLVAETEADVTATLVEEIYDHRHVRYGANVYGAILDGGTNPQLGKWDGGATAIVPQANAPFGFTDLQVHAQRLFVLGGSVPGTTTPVSAKTLYWTDTPAAAVFSDLSLLASWVDNVSGLTNQIVVDMDDTPVGLAGCGRFMAIIGSRSINILTGSGTATFAIRNLTKNWGCTDRDSIVEVDDGFYFMSDRGFAFCDGSTVQLVSDKRVTLDMDSGAPGDGLTAAAWKDGYIAVCRDSSDAKCWLFHVASGTWSTISSSSYSGNPRAVFRSMTYPLVWHGRLQYANLVTQPSTSPSGTGYDTDGTTDTPIDIMWLSRLSVLGSPTAMATVQRVFLDFRYVRTSTPVDVGFRVRVLDVLDNELLDTTTTTATVSDNPARMRFQAECFGEADAVQLEVTNALTLGATLSPPEIYDAWIEFQPARNRPTV